MAFCHCCQKEVNSEGAFCPFCGAPLNPSAQQPCPPPYPPYPPPYQAPCPPPYYSPYPPSTEPSNVSVVLGIVGIATAFLFALAGHVTSIIGIVRGVKDKNGSGLVLSIIGEVCSVLSSLIGMLIMSSLY